jgi:hypothetical protein
LPHLSLILLDSQFSQVTIKQFSVWVQRGLRRRRDSINQAKETHHAQLLQKDSKR